MNPKEKLNFEKMSIEEKEEFLVKEIKKIIAQILQWIEPQNCKCSYLPLRSLVEDAINWTIWEKYRLIKYENEDIIRRLARKIARWQL